jgi:hypothetical protein
MRNNAKPRQVVSFASIIKKQQSLGIKIQTQQK